MKKEWIVLLLIVTVTLLLSLVLMRWFAPQLLGIPVELRLVQVGKKVPPFFEGVFRLEDYKNENFLIDDPYVNRAKPLHADMGSMGPHDILGFRNRRIPNIADIITIGDSQTYGNNAVLEQNWPSQLVVNLKNQSPVLYNMSVGAWGAAQYFEMFAKALLFQPRIVIIAFYTGNDPLDSFIRVYGDKRWDFLQPDSRISAADAPKVKFPPPESDLWRVSFNDGITTTFAPEYRRSSNQDHPAVHAGYAIMLEVARGISVMARRDNVKVVFTIIPTKELVYAKKIDRDGISAPSDYTALVRDEQSNLENLAGELTRISDCFYIDLLKPMQQKALGDAPLYPETENGHPISTGYGVIAKALTPKIEKQLPARPEGLVSIGYGPEKDKVFLIRDNHKWAFGSLQMVIKNGWFKKDLRTVTPRDIGNLPFGGIINTIDPERFGPL